MISVNYIQHRKQLYLLEDPVIFLATFVHIYLFICVNVNFVIKHAG